MNSDKNKLKNNTIALIMIQILNYIFPFITLPYIARVLSVADYGTILFAQSLIDYFGRFVMFGFDLSAVRQLSCKDYSTKQINYIFNNAFFAQVIFLVIGFVILNIIIFLFPKFAKDWLIYYLTYLGLIGTLLMFNWFYQGLARMKFITILNVINRLCFIFFVFLFIKKPDDYLLYPLFNSLSFLIAGLVSIVFLRKNFPVNFYIPKLKSIIESIKYSSQFFLTKVSIALYRSANSLVLGIFLTSTSVAYFVSADKIYWAVLSLSLTFVNALFPYMSKNKDIVFFKKILKYLIILSVVFTLFMLFASKYIIILLYSDKYLPSVNILRLMSLSFALYFFTDVLGFPVLGACGYIKETNACYILGGLYNLFGILVLIFINKISIYSITLLILSTYIVMFLHRIYFIKKYKILDKE